MFISHRLSFGYGRGRPRCTHYSYAVRIDQTHSDLRLRDPESQLKPVPINGPELYFDQGAEIASFVATQGDAYTELKKRRAAQLGTFFLGSG